MRSYEAARTLFSILGFFAWCAIIIGGLLAVGGMSIGSQMRGFGVGSSGMAAFMGALPGIYLAFVGFLGLVLVQMGRANVDTAELSQQMLKVARDQLQVSQQSLAQGKTLAEGYASLAKPEVKTTPQYSLKPDQPKTKSDPAPAGTGPGGYRVGEVIEYQSQTIHVTDTGFSVGEKTFLVLEQARAFINLGNAKAIGARHQDKPNASPLGVNPRSADRAEPVLTNRAPGAGKSRTKTELPSFLNKPDTP